MEERRGRPTTIVQEPIVSKFSRVYEDDETITTWTFDLDKFDRGPISVDIKYKVGADKAIKARAKEAKQIKKTARQMKKINNKNKK
jgi:hypothetical protein